MHRSVVHSNLCQQSIDGSLPSSVEQYYKKVLALAALCHRHREDIRKMRDWPRRYSSLKGLPLIDPKLRSKDGLDQVTKDQFRYACKLRERTVLETCSREIAGVHVSEMRAPLLALKPTSQFVGTRILQLTDIHLKSDDPRALRRFAKFIEEIPALNIDIVGITGDLADSSKKDISPEAVRILTKLKGTVPNTYFVCGNHDHDAGIKDVIAKVQAAGIRVLIDEKEILGSGEDCLQIIGLEDLYHHRKNDKHFYRHGTISSKHFLRGVPSIGFMHSIDSLCDADDPNILDLVFSGHTHGLLFKGFPGNKKWLEYHWGERLLYDHNEQYTGWKALNPRTLSIVSNGFTDDHRQGVKKGSRFMQHAEVVIVEIHPMDG